MQKDNIEILTANNFSGRTYTKSDLCDLLGFAIENLESALKLSQISSELAVTRDLDAVHAELVSILAEVLRR